MRLRWVVLATVATLAAAVAIGVGVRAMTQRDPVPVSRPAVTAPRETPTTPGACVVEKRGSRLQLEISSDDPAACNNFAQQESGDGILWSRTDSRPTSPVACAVIAESDVETITAYDSGNQSAALAVCGNLVHRGWREVVGDPG